MEAMTLPPQDLPPGQALLATPLGTANAPQAARVHTYPLRFTGQASEYFRVWIVNLALTVITLGLYTPWARIRTRQYLYGHTWLDDQNFEYTASPFALLRGYLIVVAFFGLYTAAQQLQFTGWEWVTGALGLLFAVAYPWLVRQSMRFQARSTVHRGLRFRFTGSLGDAYVSYGVANIAAVVSGSLALPWAWFMQRALPGRRSCLRHGAWALSRQLGALLSDRAGGGRLDRARHRAPRRGRHRGCCYCWRPR